MKTAMSSLVDARARELGISKVELVKLCGFRNTSKGLRRLKEVCVGDFDRSQFLLDSLADALSVEPSSVRAAVVMTKQANQLAHDERYRQGFIPHAIIICQRASPDPIWLAALIGIVRILRINFAPGSSPVSFVDQARKGIADRLSEFNSEKTLPAFGRPVGFAVAYSANRTLTFDLLGNPLRIFDHAIEAGNAFLSIRGRTISNDELQYLMSFR